MQAVKNFIVGLFPGAVITGGIVVAVYNSLGHSESIVVPVLLVLLPPLLLIILSLIVGKIIFAFSDMSLRIIAFAAALILGIVLYFV